MHWKISYAVYSYLTGNLIFHATIIVPKIGGRVVQIGEFPAGAPHDITGIVKFTSPTTIVIENFNFDGAPPGIFFLQIICPCMHA